VGSSKSFRMTDKVENMFMSLKKYYSKNNKTTDSDIISTGIEMQFEDVSELVNKRFRELYSYTIREEKLVSFMNDICDILESLSYSDGYFLEDEFRYFLYAVFGDDFLYVYEDEKEKLSLAQYQKAREIISARNKNFDDQIGDIESLFIKYYEKQ